MRYYSLNRRADVVDFKTATILGQAPDKGLYFPESIPTVSADFIADLNNISNEAIAFDVIAPYVGDCIPQQELQRIVTETINFDFPVVKITDHISALELYHGPTLAFKDVGARFMSRCLSYFVQSNRQEKVTVLVATSGDTGGAVANGFYDVDGVEVVILYPKGKVSMVQELQLTTLGKNIKTLAVEGTFDDCQKMVKQAFADETLTSNMFLTSANSINVARWLPQQFYYFFALKQMDYKNNPPVIAVPSGNFGNICAGLLAQHSGLPIKYFIAACNANDTIPEFFNTGTISEKNAVATISNAMDVAKPSNFVRILEILGNELIQLKQKMSAVTVSDETTKEVLVNVFAQHNYLLDPHGAVAYAALADYLEHNTQDNGLIVETAHPVKFYDVVEPLINVSIDLPKSISDLLGKEKFVATIPADFNQLKDFLLR